MAKDYKPGRAVIQKAMGSQAVKSSLAKKAGPVQAEVSSLFKSDVSSSEGVRSSTGRPYARVSVEVTPDMKVTEAQRTLARVAGRHNAPK